VKKDMYIRTVSNISVIDGDTFRCTVDLGFFVSVKMSCRLVGINALEINEPGGHEAKMHLADLLFAGVMNENPITIQSVRTDKFAGRFDAIVYAGNFNVNDAMIASGFAVPWDGTGPKPKVPWPPVTS
jgi:endonuclease YncB( thermonuclease family)